MKITVEKVVRIRVFPAPPAPETLVPPSSQVRLILGPSYRLQLYVNSDLSQLLLQFLGDQRCDSRLL